MAHFNLKLDLGLHWRTITVAVGLALLAASCFADASTEPQSSSLTSADRYVVVLRPSAAPEPVARAAGVRPDFVYRHALSGFAAPLSPAAVAHLAASPEVQWIEPDRPFHAVEQQLPTGIDRIDADMSGVGAGPVDVDVAVIDTGIDYTHPDLNVVHRVDCSGGGPYGGGCEDNSGTDQAGHGTHVAGTIAALGNDIGVVGVAPGARLWSVRVLDQRGNGWTSWIIGGIDWVTAHADQIEVANMSLGGPGSDDTDGGDCHGTSDALHLAICNSVDAGVFYAVAAGNESDDAANHTPAAYDEVLTVSALADFDGAPGGFGAATCRADEDDSFANFSNYGHDVDILAPGVCILSTVPGGYGTGSGTSMASPHAAGAAALLIAERGAPSDAAGVALIRAALVAAGDTSPCATPSGECADDPDGVQEPLLYVGNPCATAAECDDGNECTTDTCDAGGTCGHASVADGASCAGGAGLCCAGSCGAPACASDADCDDGDACTTDTCQNAGTCAASCGATWPACGYDDLCCGPACSGASDPDCSTSACGDGYCAGFAAGEDCESCPADCRCAGRACAKACCGDGSCTGNESVRNCPIDCA